MPLWMMTPDGESARGGFPRTRRSLVEGLRDWEDAGRWGEFARLYSPMVLALARKAGLRDTDAEEVLQEVLVRTASSMRDDRRRYRPEGGSFRGWLMNTVRWKIGEQFKKLKRRARDGEGGAEDTLADMPDNTQAHGAAEVEREWQDMLLATAVEQAKGLVSVKQYQIFQLAVLNDMSPAEVSAQLGVSRAQVYLAKHRVGQLVKVEARRLASQAEAVERRLLNSPS